MKRERVNVTQIQIEDVKNHAIIKGNEKYRYKIFIHSMKVYQKLWKEIWDRHSSVRRKKCLYKKIEIGIEVTFFRKQHLKERMIFISMTLTDTKIDMKNANLIKLDKTDQEKSEEKTRYNNFMNFMTDIVIKYGLNENE